MPKFIGWERILRLYHPENNQRLELNKISRIACPAAQERCQESVCWMCLSSEKNRRKVNFSTPTILKRWLNLMLAEGLLIKAVRASINNLETSILPNFLVVWGKMIRRLTIIFLNALNSLSTRRFFQKNQIRLLLRSSRGNLLNSRKTFSLFPRIMVRLTWKNMPV